MARIPAGAHKVRVDHYGPAGRSAWLDVDWREHQRFVEVGGKRANVVDLGSGEETVVFVHGLSGCWQNWLENLPAAAEGRRAIAVDLPGFGGSEMPGEKITISGYGRFVDEALDALDVTGPVTLVGNSMGGFTAAEVAIRFPERVERLVLVSAAGLSVEDLRNDRVLAGLQRADELLTMYGAWIATNATQLVRRPGVRRALLGMVAAHPDELPGPLVSELLSGSGKPGFLQAIDALTSYPIRERLPEIACPTLIVWGDRDRLVPPRDAYEFERLIPRSRVVMYEDTGHCAMFERPEAFNALLEEFLAEDLEAADDAQAAAGDAAA